MTSVDDLAFLRTQPGMALLREAAVTPGSLPQRVARLRKTHPPDLVAAALEQVALRERAAAKFTHAARMLFTQAGVEQASADAVAAWRAARFPVGATVLDLCCGNGGDALALAERGPVLAFDVNPAAAFCARSNAESLEHSDAIHVAIADVTKLRLRGDAAFFDPSRRKDGRRIRGGNAYQPPLGFVNTIRESIPDLCVKVSPAIEDQELEALGARVEFVSLRGECREAALWFGSIGTRAARCASVLPSSATLDHDPESPRPPLSEPLNWLYDPDPAVSRAHLTPELAAILDAAQLDPQIAYLTSINHTVTPFATAYRILEWMPFSLKRVERRLREMGRRVYAIKRRGVPLDPVELSRDLRGAGDQQAVVVLTRVHGKPAAVLCERGDLPPRSNDN
jgi:SAM-dependent methyltransferase